MPGFVAHVFNPSTWEAIAGLYKFRAGLVYIASSRPLRVTNLSQKKKQRRINA